MDEESENNIENNLNIHDWNVERLNMLKKYELFELCAKNQIKVNKREDKKAI